MSCSLSSKALNKTTTLPFIDTENMLMTERMYNDHAPAPGMLLFISSFFNSQPNSKVRISKKAFSPQLSGDVLLRCKLSISCHFHLNDPHSVSSLTVHTCHMHNSETLKTLPAFMGPVQTTVWSKTTSTNALLEVHTVEQKVYQNCFVELQGFCNN